MSRLLVVVLLAVVVGLMASPPSCAVPVKTSQTHRSLAWRVAAVMRGQRPCPSSSRRSQPRSHSSSDPSPPSHQSARSAAGCSAAAVPRVALTRLAPPRHRQQQQAARLAAVGAQGLQAAGPSSCRASTAQTAPAGSSSVTAGPSVSGPVSATGSGPACRVMTGTRTVAGLAPTGRAGQQTLQRTAGARAPRHQAAARQQLQGAALPPAWACAWGTSKTQYTAPTRRRPTRPCFSGAGGTALCTTGTATSGTPAASCYWRPAAASPHSPRRPVAAAAAAAGGPRHQTAGGSAVTAAATSSKQHPAGMATGGLAAHSSSSSKAATAAAGQLQAMLRRVCASLAARPAGPHPGSSMPTHPWVAAPLVRPW